MFTGIIQETGSVQSLQQRHGSPGTRITISAPKILAELNTGDSVAVSGVCLTAVDITPNSFSADLAEETLKRTSLGSLHQGSVVNLELPARPMDRLGGHVVQGHVDGTARLLSVAPVAGRDDRRLALELPSHLARYVVPQGSISVEGISLTVASIEGARVEIAIIPHTWQNTNLHRLSPGATLNIEVDVLAKYVEKLLAGTKETAGA